MTARLPLSLTLGPVLYLWEPGEWRDFYFRIADEAPVDTVSLGEVVCSKRLHFTQPLLDAVIQRLHNAGKQVTLASLALVTTEREAIHHRKLASDADGLIEANDLSMLPLLAGRPHVVGPYVNVYNAAMARLLATKGAVRICLPPELPLAAIAAIAGAAPQVDIEVLAFGRLPLAISARCAHARAKGHSKDNCQFVCGEDRDGLLVETLDDQPFLTLNGVQTLSHTCHVALPQLGALAKAGVRHIRLSPQHCDMVAVSRLYADVRDGRISAEVACAELARLYPDVPFSNGFLHAAAGNQWVAAEAHAL